MSRSTSTLVARARAAAFMLLSLGLLLPPPEAQAVAQRVGDFELAIDAPWRMEPQQGPPVACDPSLGCQGGTPSYRYRAIPIQVTIHDADQPGAIGTSIFQKIIRASDDGVPAATLIWHFLEPVVRAMNGWVANRIEDLIDPDPIDIEKIQRTELEEFVSITVFEKVGDVYQARDTFGVNQMHEVELTDGIWRWAPGQDTTSANQPPPPRPAHTICRRWEGDDCSEMADLRGTSEWHAIAMYEPESALPGRDVRLKIALVARGLIDGLPGTRVYEEFVSVHMGEAPLPRFDARWIYGDLHYHSQGTDNDGESAYSYRGTLQAMSAMGLDFAFATDHTSNSPQIMSARTSGDAAIVEPVFRGLRDLSPDRFAFGLDLVNGPRGANREVVSYARRRGGFASPLLTPQLFLGSEADVIPEMELGEPPPHDYSMACEEAHPVMKALALIDNLGEIVENLPSLGSATVCQPDLAANIPLLLDVKPDGRRLIRDVQGPADGRFLSTSFYGRQHLIHLPKDPARTDAVILANTSKYGGATRRLGDVLATDLERDRKGPAFLAHPFAHARGRGPGRAGPDIVPFSDAQLRDAFASPHILGFQAWNENGQQSTELGSGDSTEADGTVVPIADLDDWLHEKQKRKQLYLDLQRWDRMLLWGIQSITTAELGWLDPGEPRRFFFAGGSDAHGDFNYRREGYFLGNESINDTAIGTPRNLVFAGEPEGERLFGEGGSGTPHTQGQIVEALRKGNFAVTDGPAVRIAYDSNRNGTIDDDDVPMGGVAIEDGCSLAFVVEWLSTPEFGPVGRIDLRMGVAADELDYGMVYQTTREQPVVPGNATLFTDLDGNEYYRSPSVLHWYDPTLSRLTIQVAVGEEFAGSRTILIDPSDFPVGLAHAVCEDEYQVLQAVTTPTTSYALDMGFGSSALAISAGGGFGGGGTFEWEDGPDEPPPLCDTVYLFEDPVTPDRFFMRAEVTNEIAPGTNHDCDDPYAPIDPSEAPTEQCIFRKAVSNPVWVRYQPGPAMSICMGQSDISTGTVYEDPTSEPSEPEPGPVSTSYPYTATKAELTATPPSKGAGLFGTSGLRLR